MQYIPNNKSKSPKKSTLVDSFATVLRVYTKFDNPQLMARVMIAKSPPRKLLKIAKQQEKEIQTLEDDETQFLTQDINMEGSKLLYYATQEKDK